MRNNNGFVYCIKDDGVVVYVGATINTKKRFYYHLNYTFSTHPNKNVLSLEILQECQRNEMGKREIYWINYFLNSGNNLINKNKSGHGGHGEDAEMSSVKLSSSIIEKVRKYKEATGIPIGFFFEQAALEKLLSKVKISNNKK